MRLSRGIPLILAAIVCLRGFSLATAAVLHVSQSDPACGGKTPCFPTIQAAVKAAEGGDTVEIQPGVYREKILVSSKNTSSGAGEDQRIVITASPGSVTVAAPGKGPDAETRPQPVDREARGLIMIHHSRFVTIRGLTITGSRAAGIQLKGGNSQNSGIHLERNRLLGNGSRFGEGGIIVEPGNPGTVISNNLIHANLGDGIRIESDKDTKGQGAPPGKDLPSDDGESPIFLVENTIHGNGWNGVAIEASGPVTLVNNAITSNGTLPADAGGRSGVLLRGSFGAGDEGLSLYNNLICGNRLGETSGGVFAGQHADNMTPLGTESAGVIATPECATPEGVYASLAGPDGRAGTPDDDFKLLGAGTGHLPSPALDRGADPAALGLDLHFDAALFLADYTAPDIRPVDKDINRPLDYDVGAFELPCDCPNICFSQCRITVDPDTGSSRETCAASPFWSPSTQCCDSSTGQVSERFPGGEGAMTACPDNRFPNPAHILCDDTDGCSFGNPANFDNPTDPLEACGAHFRFGTSDPNEDLPCNNHDCCYETCNRSKAECDQVFYEDMLAVCNQPVGFICAQLVPDCLTWAANYFDGVVVFSGSSYTSGQNRACQCCMNR